MDRRLKYIVFFSIGLIYCCSLQAQNKLTPLTDKMVNWGFNVGVNALSTTHFDVFQGETRLENTSYTNEVGFTGGTFIRINLNNFFMQPEFAYYYSQEKFAFERLSSTGSPTQETSVNAHYHSLIVPVLAGYNIVKENHFLFNVYMGPDFQYRYRTSFDQGGIHFINKSPQYSVNGIIGFSLNISHLFFDFRYEINRPNTNINFNDIVNAPEYLKDISVKKNENILSFSCGLMF